MKSPICSVYDKKTGLFENPFACRHVAEAVRGWDVVRKDPNTKFCQSPEDFILYQIGTFDAALGTFESVQPHVALAAGV